MHFEIRGLSPPNRQPKAIKQTPPILNPNQIRPKRETLMGANLSSSLLIVDGGNQISQKLVIASFD